MRQFTPAECVDYLRNAGALVQILDVREPWEYDTVHLQGSILIPLGRLMSAMDRLDKDKELLVVCHHGIRSHYACLILERNGFATINLTGGIDRWARELDPEMPVY